MYGWTGQRLKVYLTEGKIVSEPIPDDLRLNYFGGRGLNSKTLFDELKPGIDPLSPENIFMVGVGPLNGTAMPASARWTVTAKSTITNGLGDGNGGGDFATELKYAGFDQVIFYGRSPKPVYLFVHDGHAELRDAAHLWGQTTGITNKLLWQETGDRDVRVLCIGPAGENLVRLAKVFSNITRTGGKGGIGAVMGSKNLKAVAVRGNGSVKIAHPAEFMQATRDAYAKLMKSPRCKMFMKEGTLWLIRMQSQAHDLSTRNAQEGYFEGWEKLTTEAFESQHAVKHKGCSACPVSCSHYYEVKDGPYTTHGESNEFGTTYPFGPKCGIDNLAAILKMDTLCDQLGLDTHSTGATVCFAMECWQRELLTAKDTDGINLNWGNADAVLQLLPKIAYRQGFGKLLAEGSYRASKEIKGSEVCLRTTKGMEVSALYIGPVTNVVQSIGYATATRGADHLRGGVHLCGANMPRLKEILGSTEAVQATLQKPKQLEGKAAYLMVEQDFMSALNCLEICCQVVGRLFQALDDEDLARFVTHGTGIETTSNDLFKLGERVTNIEKAFNIREGMGRKDDSLPNIFFQERQTPYGPSGMSEAAFNKLLDDYYQIRGWDHEGIPTRTKLAELGLSDIAEQIGAN